MLVLSKCYNINTECVERITVLQPLIEGLEGRTSQSQA